MQLEFHQVDAFSSRPFSGNPAVVYRLDAWLADELMQMIATEHNLSETAFVVREGEAWRIRWFTPSVEVALCGHATLAAAHVLFEVYDEVQERFAKRERPRPELSGDADLVAALDTLFEENAKLESWALGMKSHIDYLENTGEGGQPVRKFTQHLKFLAKSKVREWRER